MIRAPDTATAPSRVSVEYFVSGIWKMLSPMAATNTAAIP